ncbi:midasin-like isoform X2 [Pecten maximus]|uniref:midasin-like isoform X2 n=1 Tax=Pecten maximus TaxID=6579 RepID=UPI0014583BC8|nr:midasin-like isoform X2 [Pecten maximus]
MNITDVSFSNGCDNYEEVHTVASEFAETWPRSAYGVMLSAFVLDRLNALLEPHGVLNINERGVIDGVIPTITPHPNFRRMGHYTALMMSRSCYKVKVSDDGACDWLMSLHTDMRENISLGERPVILDLIRAAMDLPWVDGTTLSFVTYMYCCPRRKNC